MQFKALKNKICEFYTLITGEVSTDATLAGLTSASKTAEFNLWMYVLSGMSVVMDGLWEDRQTIISDKVDSGLIGSDRWLHRELLKFQLGDSLSWDDDQGIYYYPVIDATKQIIKRCAVNSSGGVTSVKVAKEVSALPVPLSGPELTAFTTYVRTFQFAGANITNPVSQNSDKLNAPMTIYYNGTRLLADVKVIVEAAFNEYLASLPFNGEYSVNKHGDFIEAKDLDIFEVDMGAVQAKADAGMYASVTRICLPFSGYIERDSAIAFDDMITYVAQ